MPFSFSPAQTTVVEGNTTLTFTINRSGGTPAQTLYYSTLFDTATAGSGDYTGIVDQQVVFASGQTQATVSVTIRDDAVVEVQEHFRLMLAATTGASSANAVALADIYINDNDTVQPSAFSFSPAQTTVVEGNTTLTFTINRSGGTPAQTLYYSTLFDTATAGSGDYTGIVDQQVVFASGQTQATVSVTIRDDAVVEVQEHFRLMLAATTGASSANAVALADIYINDNDTVQPSAFSFSPAQTTVVEGNTTLTFTINRSGGTPAQTLYYSTLFDTATAGSGDYTGIVDQQVVFASGQTQATVSVTIRDDAVVEVQEHFRLMLAATTGASSANAVALADIYINDNDTVQPSAFSFSPAQTTVVEGNTTLTFTINRSGGTPAQTLYYSTLFDTATAGSGDYTGIVDQQVVFASGQTQATVSVTIRDDAVVEVQEHFRLMLAATTGASSANAVALADIYINDNDTVQPSAFSFSPAQTTVVEGNTTLTFTINRSGGTPAQTLYYSTLFDTATAGSGDYTGIVDQQVVFASGQTQATVSVTIRDDAVVEVQEHFRLMLAATTGASSANAVALADIYINDNDTVQPSAFSFSPAQTTVVEGNTTLTFTINRSGGTPAQTLYYSTLFDTASSANGDYYGFADQGVNFTAGQTQVAVSVILRDDAIIEQTEHFRIMLAGSTGASSSQAVAIADVYVSDNDSGGGQTGYSFSPTARTVAEEDVTITFTLSRTGSFPAETLYASTLYDTASSAAGDYVGIINQTVTFLAGQTSTAVSVTIKQDQFIEGAEHFRLMVAKQLWAQSSDAVAISDIEITDDDGTPSSDVVGANISTAPVLLAGAGLVGVIDQNDISGDVIDRDYYRVDLTAGHVYRFAARATVSQTDSLDAVLVRLRDGNGNLMSPDLWGDGAVTGFDFAAGTTGSYYLAIGAGGAGTFQEKTGQYALSYTDLGTQTGDDFADDASDAGAPVGLVTVGGAGTTGVIGAADVNDVYGDKDVFRVSLVRGQTYEFNLQSLAVGASALPIGVFTLREPDNFGSVLRTSNVGSNVVVTWLSEQTGDYYLRVGSGSASTDQGGYRLTAANITPVQSATDDFADYAGDVSSANGVGLIVLGRSRVGSIQSAGDKDTFSVSLTAGHNYQFHLDGYGTSELQQVYLSLRDGQYFDSILKQGGGASSATLGFTATETGIEYLRVGAGGYNASTLTGGYRLSTVDMGVVSPIVPVPLAAPVAAAEAWFSDSAYTNIGTLFEFAGVRWSVLETILQSAKSGSAIADYAGAARIAGKIGVFWGGVGIAWRLTEVLDHINQAADKYEALYIEVGDFLGELLATNIGKLGGTLIGLASGGPGSAIIGQLVGGFGGSLIYNYAGISNKVQDYYDELWDGVIDRPWASGTPALLNSSARMAAFSTPVDIDGNPIVFDENYYLTTYSLALTALKNGSAADAFDHFLTFGIDNGYRPNAVQIVTRAGVATSIVNNDPAAGIFTSQFSLQLGTMNGDGISAFESNVASSINALRASGLVTDGTLSSIAHRKAMDIVHNALNVSAAQAVAGNEDSAWAQNWSNGNAFYQQFFGELESVGGVDSGDVPFKLMVTSSATASVSEVISKFNAQMSGAATLADARYDAIGVAEYGGIWIIILADTASGFTVTAQQGDTQTRTIQYGGGLNDILLAGARAATLYGGEGNDTFIGGSSADIIYGDAGNDTLTGGPGDDTLNGGNDIDTADYSEATTTAYLHLDTAAQTGTYATGPGGAFETDILVAIENLIAGSGADYLFGSAAANLLVGNGDHDWFSAGDGDDSVDGGAGRDYVEASYAADSVSGGADDDTIYGGAHNDTLLGDDGNDFLFGEHGYDTLLGGNGSDVLFVDSLDGFFDGGAGIDYLVWHDVSVAAFVDLAAHSLDIAYGYSGSDIFYATGATARIELHGGDGNDVLVGGGSGGSILLGENGDDRLVGEIGVDNMVGGAGADTFVFAAGGGVDFIFTFERGPDRIDMTALAASGVHSLADLTINTIYSAAGWYGYSYGTGAVWVQTGGQGSLTTPEFIFV